MTFHPPEGYLSSLFEELSGGIEASKLQTDFDVSQALKDKLDGSMSSKLFGPPASSNVFDSRAQKALISEVFKMKGLKLREEIVDFVLAKGAARQSLILAQELIWLCDGISLEQKYSIIARGEQMIDQLKSELIKASSLTSNLSELEYKMKENVSSLGKIRFTPAEAPKQPSILGGVTNDVSVFDLRQVIIAVGIPPDLAAMDNLDSRFRRFITKDIVSVYKQNKLSTELKNILKTQILKELLKGKSLA